MVFGLFGRRRKRADAAELARVLHAEFIEATKGPPDTFEPPPQNADLFAEHARLQRIAMVIMSLELARQRHSRYNRVISEFEGFVFPATPDPELLADVREAMRNVASLISPSGPKRELSWARTWLLVSGIDTANPVDLTLHAVAWMGLWRTINESLDEFEPF